MLNNDRQSEFSARVFQIIEDFQKTENHKDAVHNILRDICDLFEFGKVSMIVEDVRYSSYVNAFTYELDGESKDFWTNNNVNNYFHASVIDKSCDKQREEFVSYLGDEKIVFIKNYYEVRDFLLNIGFEPAHNPVKDLYVAYILEGSFFCYFVFENFENFEIHIDEDDTDTVNDTYFRLLLNLAIERIGRSELSKQLYSTDLLTNAPSIKSFYDYYKNTVVKSDLDYALCTIDVDKFKYINNVYGYIVGDDLLKKIAFVLRDFVLENEMFCRINEDRFGFIIHYENDVELQGRINQLINNFECMRRMDFPDKRIIVVGGITFIDKSSELNLIIDHANFARKSIKGSHQNNFTYYDVRIDAQIAKIREIEEKMFDAIKNDEFFPFLQPKFHLETMEIYGAEALVRWKSKQGFIYPDEFIPVFEKNGFIGVLDFVIYEKTMQHIRKYLDLNMKIYPISINVSRSHIQDKDFMFKIMDLINHYDIPKDLLELEVTESVFVEDKKQLQDFIDLIKEQGLKVSIDDFGTAYSSLHILKDVNVDVLKIDKEFLYNVNNSNIDSNNTEIISNTKDEIVIKHIISMAKELGFDIICEGIETKEQVELLKSIGCQLGQGYLFSKPLPIDEYVQKYYKVNE